jgi:hypothetical protein
MFTAIESDDPKAIAGVFSQVDCDINDISFLLRQDQQEAQGFNLSFSAPALHVAKLLGKDRAQEWLVRHGADPLALDSLGRSAYELGNRSRFNDMRRERGGVREPSNTAISLGLERLGDQVLLSRALAAQEKESGGSEHESDVGGGSRGRHGNSNMVLTSSEWKQIRKVVKKQEQRIQDNMDEIDNLYMRLDAQEKLVNKLVAAQKSAKTANDRQNLLTYRKSRVTGGGSCCVIS